MSSTRNTAILATFLGSILGALPSFALAGSVTNATVGQITYFEGTNLLGQDGFALVTTNGTDSGKPACAQGVWGTSFAVNPGTTGGAAILAALITAQAQGSLVSITGTDTCTITSGSETLGFMAVTP